MHRDNRLAYWRANLRLVAVCLFTWFVSSYVFGILLVEQLNSFRIGDFQLGFWFAQNWLPGISPEGIGVIGMCLNFVVAITISTVTRPPPEHIQHMVEHIRVPQHRD